MTHRIKKADVLIKTNFSFRACNGASKCRKASEVRSSRKCSVSCLQHSHESSELSTKINCANPSLFYVLSCVCTYYLSAGRCNTC